MDLPTAKYKSKIQVTSFYNELLLRLQAMPQVESAAVAITFRLDTALSPSYFWIDGQPAPAPDEVPVAIVNSVSSSYLAAMGLHLVQGRFYRRIRRPECSSGDRDQ